MNLPTRKLDLRGGHRGGRALTRALLERGKLPPLCIRIVDQVETRATDLAHTWSEQGHLAFPFAADARLVACDDDLDILGLCTDDPMVQLQLIEIGRARLITMGLLIASADAGYYGGRILGFGATVPEEDYAPRRAAGLLFERIALLTGGARSSSRELNTPLLNAPQVGVVREKLYSRLACDASDYLLTGCVGAALYVSMAWPTPAIYPLYVRQRQRTTRTTMRAETERFTAAGDSGQAIAWMDDDDPAWLFVSVAKAGQTTFSIELPRSPIEAQLEDTRIVATD